MKILITAGGGKGALADVDVIVEYLDSIDSREG